MVTQETHQLNEDIQNSNNVSGHKFTLTTIKWTQVYKYVIRLQPVHILFRILI